MIYQERSIDPFVDQVVAAYGGILRMAVYGDPNQIDQDFLDSIARLGHSTSNELQVLKIARDVGFRLPHYTYTQYSPDMKSLHTPHTGDLGRVTTLGNGDATWEVFQVDQCYELDLDVSFKRIPGLSLY
jgi:hypothetical protein